MNHAPPEGVGGRDTQLRVYASAEHPHAAQQPTPLSFNKSEK